MPCSSSDENLQVGIPTAAAVSAFREEHGIEMRCESEGGSFTQPLPYLEFHHAPFLPCIRAAFKKASYTTPTPIQAAAWPVVMAGYDLIAVAKTGSGKTAVSMPNMPPWPFSLFFASLWPLRSTVCVYVRLWLSSSRLDHDACCVPGLSGTGGDACD